MAFVGKKIEPRWTGSAKEEDGAKKAKEGENREGKK